jgi:hypothetical protein
MDEKTKVVVDITKETDADAVVKTETVIEKLGASSTTYPSPTVPVTTLETDKSDFVEKIAKAQHGGTAETLAKNLAREIINSNYRSDGNYVNSIAKGDKTKLLLSGYELAKTRTKPKPEDFELVNQSESGSIMVFCRQKPKGYIVKMLQFSSDPQLADSWKSGGVTRKIKKVIKNLPVGHRVWVRLAIVMNEDIVEYGDPISIIVL